MPRMAWIALSLGIGALLLAVFLPPGDVAWLRREIAPLSRALSWTARVAEQAQHGAAVHLVREAGDGGDARGLGKPLQQPRGAALDRSACAQPLVHQRHHALVAGRGDHRRARGVGVGKRRDRLAAQHGAEPTARVVGLSHATRARGATRRRSRTPRPGR